MKIPSHRAIRIVGVTSFFGILGGVYGATKGFLEIGTLVASFSGVALVVSEFTSLLRDKEDRKERFKGLESLNR